MQGLVYKGKRRELTRVGKFLILFPALSGVYAFGIAVLPGEVHRPANCLERGSRPGLQASRYPHQEQACSQPHQSSHLLCMAAQCH